MASRRFTQFLDKRAPFFFLLPCVLFLFVLTLFPTVFLVFASLRDWSLMDQGNGVFVGFANYAELWRSDRFRSALANTFTFTGVGVSCQLVLGMVVALLLSRSFSGASIARGLMLLPMIATPIVVGLTWRMLYDPIFGQINFFLGIVGLPRPEWLSSAATAMPALIITDIWEWTPFMSLILLAGLQSVPRDQYEAASLDGAGPIATFFFITVPAIWPLMLVAVLFRTMDSLRWFDTIYIMPNGGPGISTETANLYAYIVSFNNAEIGLGSAISVTVLIIVILISFTLVRLSNIEKRT